ncbi:MAG: hypothetical protein JSV88_17700, partial [Candidatus Aminicenantes bacterium]
MGSNKRTQKSTFVKITFDTVPPIRILLVLYLISKSIMYYASGGQGLFLKKPPLDPAKTFY